MADECETCGANPQTCGARGGCCRLCTHAVDVPAQREPSDGYRKVPISHVFPHPGNVRANVGDVKDLAASIREQGIIQPLIVAVRDGGGLVLIAGHRRLAAAKLAGLKSVPVVVRRDLTANEIFQAMLVENLHRVDLSPLEEARALGRLVAAGIPQKDLARRIGRSAAHVSTRLLLNDLPDEVRGRLTAKEITLGEAQRIALELKGRPLGEVDRGWAKPWFTAQHPLAWKVAERCDHALRRRLGPGCGECWETAIREDAKLTIDIERDLSMSGANGCEK